MSYMVAASTGFAIARAIYRDGHKSSNKLHLNPNSPFANGQVSGDNVLDFGIEQGETNTAYDDRLAAANRQLGGHRGRFRIGVGHFLKDGAAMLRMRPVAANCGELAMMAAAGAWDGLGKPAPAPVALVSLADPADHVFCVVGPRVHLAQLHNLNMQELVTSFLAMNAWAADPWLNILCRLRDYPARAQTKFNKWQQANKRVAWETGPLGPGWYPPVGAYSDGFSDAGLEVFLG